MHDQSVQNYRFSVPYRVAMKWAGFSVILSFQMHCSPSQVYPKKSQQCGQSATYDGLFPYSPAMFIARMVIRNI